MKKTLGILAFTVLLFGCNVNPSKEARIQQLESEMQQSMEKIEELEERILVLEEFSASLDARPTTF